MTKRIIIENEGPLPVRALAVDFPSTGQIPRHAVANVLLMPKEKHEMYVYGGRVVEVYEEDGSNKVGKEHAT